MLRLVVFLASVVFWVQSSRSVSHASGISADNFTIHGFLQANYDMRITGQQPPNYEVSVVGLSYIHRFQ